jgi:hypothetical protein
MAPEDVSKLFQKFSQVGPHRTGQPRGTGLGLVVCKELAELHGGQISVTSQVGRGTTFTVSLPAYTHSFALNQLLREQVETAADGEGRFCALIAAQVSSLLTGPDTADARRKTLEAAAASLQQHLHRGDAVLGCSPSSRIG